MFQHQQNNNKFKIKVEEINVTRHLLFQNYGGFKLKKFLDTSNLATYQYGLYQGKYDWSNNIGKELYFEYDDISGYIKILDYKKSKPQGYITLQYNDIITTTTTPNLLHFNIPRLFGKEKLSKEYKYNIGDIINKYNDSMKILEQIRIEYNNSSNRGYKIECLDCHYIFKTTEQRLSTCPVCGKRSSYSEKFVYSIFKQANINFIPQKEFEWLHNRFYDVYLPDYNIIVEIHGEQHFKPIKLNNHETPEETYQNTLMADRIKYNAAIKNDVSYYIIDASDPKQLFHAAKNVLSFIDFSKISELECEKFASYKRIIKECELWNQGYTLEEIHAQLKEPIQSIQQKLRLGNKYSICNYSKKNEYALS